MQKKDLTIFIEEQGGNTVLNEAMGGVFNQMIVSHYLNVNWEPFSFVLGCNVQDNIPQIVFPQEIYVMSTRFVVTTEEELWRYLDTFKKINEEKRKLNV